MKKLFLLALPLLALSFSSCNKDDDAPLTYKDYVGTYTCDYTYMEDINVDPEVFERDVNTTFQITGTSAENMVFIWEDKNITIPLELHNGHVRTTEGIYKMEYDKNGVYFNIFFYVDPMAYKYILFNIE